MCQLHLITLSSFSLVCIITGVENSTQEGKLAPYPEGGTLGFVNYAQTDPNCIHAIFNYFMLYLPYILLLQTMSN